MAIAVRRISWLITETFGGTKISINLDNVENIYQTNQGTAVVVIAGSAYGDSPRVHEVVMSYDQIVKLL
jgi:hypothetical protein